MTRPCFPFSWAVTGYLMFLAKYCIKACCPPGNSGITSTTSNTTESGILLLWAIGVDFAISFLAGRATVCWISSLCSSGIFAISGWGVLTCSITSFANLSVVRATTSMLLTIINRAAKGRNMIYFVLPISLVLRLFIILIRFLSGKTLKLFDKFAAALWWASPNKWYWYDLLSCPVSNTRLSAMYSRLPLTSRFISQLNGLNQQNMHIISLINTSIEWYWRAWVSSWVIISLISESVCDCGCMNIQWKKEQGSPTSSNW